MSDDGTTVACPVGGCAFRDTASLVAAHVNGTDAAGHDWDALRFGGPRDFLQQARNGWLDDGDESDGDSPERVQSKADDTSRSGANHTSQSSGEKTDTAGADASEPGPVPVGEVRCPADGCHYTDELASLKAHISGTHDAAHDSDRLRERGIYPDEADVKGESGPADPTASADAIDGTEDPPTGTTDATATDDAATDDAATATATDDTATDTTTDDTASDDTRITGDTTVSELLDLLDAAESEALPVDTAAVETALVFCDLLSDLGEAPDTRTLVDAYTLASDLAAEAGDARTDLRDELLDRTDSDGELAGEVGTVRRVTRTRRSLRDDGVVLARLREAGVDPDSVLRPDSTRVRETLDAADLPESLAFDVTESSYVQKSASDDEAKRARLAALRRRSEE